MEDYMGAIVVLFSLTQFCVSAYLLLVANNENKEVKESNKDLFKLLGDANAKLNSLSKYTIADKQQRINTLLNEVSKLQGQLERERGKNG